MQGAEDRRNTRIFRDYAVCVAQKNGEAGDVCLDFVTQLTLFCFLVYDLSLPISLFVRIIIQNVVARSVSNVVDFILYQNMPNVKQFRKNLTIYLQVPQFVALSDNI